MLVASFGVSEMADVSCSILNEELLIFIYLCLHYNDDPCCCELYVLNITFVM